MFYTLGHLGLGPVQAPGSSSVARIQDPDFQQFQGASLPVKPDSDLETVPSPALASVVSLWLVWLCWLSNFDALAVTWQEPGQQCQSLWVAYLPDSVRKIDWQQLIT